MYLQQSFFSGIKGITISSWEPFFFFFFLDRKYNSKVYLFPFPARPDTRAPHIWPKAVKVPRSTHFSSILLHV